MAAFITQLVHGAAEKDAAIRASEILFSNATDGLSQLTEKQLLDVFDGLPQAEVQRAALTAGIGIIDLLTDHTGFLPSKGEAKRALKEGSIAVNRAKAAEDRVVNAADLLSERFVLLQRGKKSYFLVRMV